jgi:tetraacyldisaccharide-1-P 4'-kinase
MVGDFVRVDGLDAKAQLSGPVHVFTAIAKPDAFLAMLQQRARTAGFVIKAIHTWPDHAPLNRLALPPTGGLPVICTAKDAVKLREHKSIDLSQCWIAPLTLSLPGEFWTAFDQALPSKNN